MLIPVARCLWRRAGSRSPWCCSSHGFATTPQIDRWQQLYGARRVALGSELCDKHPSDKVALRLTDDGREVSFGELKETSKRLASVLVDLGVKKGDRVAGMLPKGSEVMATVLATARLGACYVPLFTAFGPEAAEYRVEACAAKVIVADSTQRGKLDGVAQMAKCITVGATRSEDVDFEKAVAAASELSDSSHAEMSGDDLLTVIFTSGTTGRPKGVEVPVRALAALNTFMLYGLHVTPECTFWNVADPGWAYGLYYNVYGTMALGYTAIMQQSGFNPSVAAKVLEDYRVTNLGAAPVWYRGLRANLEPAVRWLPDLQRASSAGEPLNPSISEWLQASTANAVQIRDQYGQTEVGMVAINHWHPEFATTTHPASSMGTSMVGFSTTVVSQPEDDEGSADGAGGVVHRLNAGVTGALAIDVDPVKSPLFFFKGYLNDPQKTAERFVNGADGCKYYITGDTAEHDGEGFLYFSSRDDDVITSSAYRIGPFDVESAIMQHGAVAEVAVIGVPDPEGLRGEIVKACVVLKEGEVEKDSFLEEFKGLVRRVGAHMVPRQVQFLKELPKTPSGKVQRFLLRQRHVSEASQ